MKNLKQFTVTVFLLGALSYTNVTLAQTESPVQSKKEDHPWLHKKPEEKTAVFSKIGNKLECSIQQVFAATRQAKSGLTRVFIAPGFTLEGENAETHQPHPRMTTTFLKSSNFQGAVLTLSKVIDEQGEEFFTGRIFHPQSNEAFILTQEKGKYYFVKVSATHFMVD
jgi:hypothetical protein